MTTGFSRGRDRPPEKMPFTDPRRPFRVRVITEGYLPATETKSSMSFICAIAIHAQRPEVVAVPECAMVQGTQKHNGTDAAGAGGSM